MRVQITIQSVVRRTAAIACIIVQASSLRAATLTGGEK
jgi:hypothetical protein